MPAVVPAERRAAVQKRKTAPVEPIGALLGWTHRGAGQQQRRTGRRDGIQRIDRPDRPIHNLRGMEIAKRVQAAQRMTHRLGPVRALRFGGSHGRRVDMGIRRRLAQSFAM